MLFFLTLLFSEKSQTFQHRAVGDREDDRRLFLRHVFELVPVQRRHEEAVLWAPGKIISNALFLADRRYPLSLHDVVNRAARMTVRLGRTPRRQLLYPTADGWHRRPAGQRIGVFEQEAVVRINLFCSRDLF